MDNHGCLKIADFGLARSFGEPLKVLTPGVVTLWYRAPELLLGGDKYCYSTAIDVWSVGCIFGEFIRNTILLPGSSEVDQTKKIFRFLGTPDETSWPGWRNLSGAHGLNIPPQRYHILNQKFNETELTPKGTELLLGLLRFDPERRITAAEAIEHPYFTQEKPIPKEERHMPTFRPTQEGAHALREDVPKAAREPVKEADVKYEGSIFATSSVDMDAYLEALDAGVAKKK
jgi:cell division cycle 2-like protein